jgi:HPt (histidine-containing phosphotransfer) domain-containing protein
MGEGQTTGAIRSTFADDPDMLEIVGEFVGEMPERVQSLSEAFERGDPQTLRTLAHQLKGACGGYGFPVLSEAAAALEGELKRADYDLGVVRRELDELIALCNKAAV